MEQSLFGKLFKYREREKISPRENFLTEIFAFVLKHDKLFRELFFKKLGLLKNEKPEILTQSTYSEGRPDIEIIIDKNIHVLIEVKVGTTEGYEQLNRYSEILQKSHYPQKILVYLTKYFEHKESANEKVKIKLIRWHEVFDILCKSEELVTKQLVNYLEEQSMSKNVILNVNDVLAIRTINESTSKLDEVLYHVKPNFQNVIGSSKFPNKLDGCYWLSHSFNGVDVKCGFNWFWPKDTGVTLMTWLWIPEARTDIELIKAQLIEIKRWDCWLDEDDKGIVFAKSKSVLEFIEEEDQTKKMASFLKSGIDDLSLVLESLRLASAA